MIKRSIRSVGDVFALLKSLARDVRGNTLILLTAALIPMIGMVGGGIDISRMYILKTRLQHACDAGALAGRKTMGAGVWSFNNNAARTQAEKFFDANFETGSFGSSNLSRAFAENAGRVTGTVSAEIPMTLMKVFGKMRDTIPVTCDAEMRLPNTDVMFVLDTTGSMAETPTGGTKTKMQSLKTAVKCFYEIVARLNTNENCTTGTPSGGTGNQVQIRFGFVPYATNVNVGRLLQPGWVADSWPYQTRTLVNGNGAWSGWFNYGRMLCSAIPTNSATAEHRIIGYVSGSRCDVEKRSKVYWQYSKTSVDISGLKNGSGWNASIQKRIGDNNTWRTIDWEGCIEERETVRATDYDPIPSGANDLNIDMVPTSNVSTQWAAALPGLIFTRQELADGSGSYNRANINSTAVDYGNTSYYACPVAAQRMQRWTDPAMLDAYVDSLVPEGNTYHDIGLIWGARLASPSGIFGADNDFTDQGGEIERNIIFMTDGDACTGAGNYTAYGVAWFDRRQTADNTVPTEGCTFNDKTLTEQVNRRTEALCNAIKNHVFEGRPSFTLWVIAFGNLDPSTEDRLEECATNGRYYKAVTDAQLQTTFKQIADQISMLRLTN